MKNYWLYPFMKDNHGWHFGIMAPLFAFGRMYDIEVDHCRWYLRLGPWAYKWDKHERRVTAWKRREA